MLVKFTELVLLQTNRTFKSSSVGTRPLRTSAPSREVDGDHPTRPILDPDLEVHQRIAVRKSRGEMKGSLGFWGVFFRSSYCQMSFAPCFPAPYNFLMHPAGIFDFFSCCAPLPI